MKLVDDTVARGQEGQEISLYAKVEAMGLAFPRLRGSTSVSIRQQTRETKTIPQPRRRAA